MRSPRLIGFMYQIQGVIEVSRDVTFHKEATFNKSREIQQESEVVQPASPYSQNEESDDHREEPCEGPSNEPQEPALKC
jgi:hypothetical protein